MQGEDSGSLDCIPSVIVKLKDLDSVMAKVSVVSKDNLSPHTLDTQPSFVTACNELKDNIKNILYYAEDYNKHNWVTKKVVAGKIKGKMSQIISNMANYTRMVESLAFTHNQAQMQHMLLEQQSSNKADEIKE